MGNVLQEMSGGQLLIIWGIVLIILAITGGIISFAVFSHTGKKLKEKLKQEYGVNV